MARGQKAGSQENLKIPSELNEEILGKIKEN